MDIKVSYNTLKNRHPTEVAKLEAGLSKRRGANKTKAPSTYNWGYSWGVMIKGCSFADLVNDLQNPKPKETPDQRMQRVLKDIVGLGIWIREQGYDKFEPLTSGSPVPPEIVKLYKDSRDEEVKEEARYNALTPAQKDAELQDALGELSKMGGFMGFSIPVRPTK